MGDTYVREHVFVLLSESSRMGQKGQGEVISCEIGLFKNDAGFDFDGRFIHIKQRSCLARRSQILFQPRQQIDQFIFLFYVQVHSFLVSGKQQHD